MSTPNPSLAGNFESTAQRMLEALDKASAQLSKHVNECIEQLSTYNYGLQKSLTDQLQQVTEKLHNSCVANSDDLVKHKEKLIQQLGDGGQEELDTILAAGQAVRQALSSYTQQALEKISQRIDAQLEDLRSLLEDPKGNLVQRADSAVGELKKAGSEAKSRLIQTSTEGEQSLLQQAQEFEAELQDIVSDWKDTIAAKVAACQERFAENARKVMDELSGVMQESSSALAQKAQAGEEFLKESVQDGTQKATATFKDWKQEIDSLHEHFNQALNEQKTALDETQRADLDQKLELAHKEINGTASEALEKLKSSHQLHQSTLEKLEQEYKRRLAAVLSHFDATVSETSRRANTASTVQQRVSADLMEKLNAHLNARGAEILRSLSRLSDQMESDYAKSSQGMSERIHEIQQLSADAYSKQVQSLKSEADKTSRSFQSQLRDFESQLAQIEEAGKAAAVTVMAYRSALLSLGGE